MEHKPLQMSVAGRDCSTDLPRSEGGEWPGDESGEEEERRNGKDFHLIPALQKLVGDFEVGH